MQSDRMSGPPENAILLSQSSTVASISAEQTAHNKPRKLWSPLFLRPLILALFACVYLKAAIALSILAWYSSKHNGICRVRPADHYFWQYAPTATFTLLSTLWAQIDYHARLIMPWMLMAHKPQIADRSVLLDYVSPNVITALVKSMREKDMPVVLALCGTVLNKLLIIVSTGLFTFASVNVTLNPKATAGGTRFSSSSFNASLISQLPVARGFGIETLNMSYPFGTTNSYATEIPPPQTGDSIVDNRSPVNMFNAYANCEIARLQSTPVSSMVDGGMYQSQDSDGNKVVVYIGDEYIVTDPQGNTRTYPMLPYLIGSRGSIGSVSVATILSSETCSSITAHGKELGPPYPIADATPALTCNDDDYRFVFGFYGSVNNSAFLVCKPRYKLQTAEMTYMYKDSLDSGRWAVGDPYDDRQLDNLTGKAIAEGFLTALIGVNKTQVLSPLVPDGNASSLLDPDSLKETFSKFYNATTAQIANRYLLVDNDKGFEVTETQTQNRLQLRGYGLWITEVILTLLALDSIALSHLFKRSVTPRDPGSITGLATILARSQELTDRLRGSGLAPLETLRTVFGTDTFHTDTTAVNSETTDVFNIRQTTTSDSTHSSAKSSKWSDFAWYYPFVITLTCRMCIIVISVLIIAALEAVYQVSDLNHGFVTFATHQYDQYAWRFVPATVLVLFGLLFSALDFELKSFQPFINLKRGSVSSKKSIDDNYLGQLSIHSFWAAARKKQYCLVAIFMGTLSTQFLTIISSGLFTAQNGIQEKAIQLQQLDQFDLDSFSNISRISYQTVGMMAATLVLDDGMDIPRWTYDSFAVPTMGHPTQLDHQDDYQSIQVTVPAIRAVANCTEVFASAVSFTNDSDLIDVSFHHLSPCENHTSTSITISTANLSGDIAFWEDRSGDIYHCPEYLVVAGNLDNRNSSWKPLSLQCKPYLETLDARVELTYPDLLEIRTSTPFLDESSRAFATTAEIPGMGRNLFAPYTQNSESGTFSQTVGTHYATGDITVQLPSGAGIVDGFFGTIVQQGTLITSLTTDIEALQSAVEAMYPRVVAQVLNFNRVPADPTSALLHDGTARLPNRLRLVQNGAPTRVLQALLAAMALSAAATFALGSLKRVLPKNPRSIAAVASLLAGSAMLDAEVVPPGSEWFGDEELSRLGLVRDLRFSMGWWGGGNGGKGEAGGEERFGIDIGTAMWHEMLEK